MMQHVFRRLICFCLALALCLSLAACGTKPEQTNSTGGGSAESGQSGTAANTGYRTDDSAVYNGLFDTSRVHTVDITLSA